MSTQMLIDRSKFQGTETRPPNVEFARDLVAALAEVRNPLADQRADVPTKTGGRYSYRYAALPDILDDVRAVLGRHNLGIMQSVVQTVPGTVGILTRLQHASGAYHDFGPLVLPAAGDAQSVGSAITYGRRYALCAVLGIAADEDTDGKSKSPGESTATATRSAEPLPADRRQAGTIAAADAVPASPAPSESRSSNQPSGKATVAEDRDSEPSESESAEPPRGDVSGSGTTSGTGGDAGHAGSDGSEGDSVGEGLIGPSGSASHEQLLDEALKLVGNKESRLRGYVNTFCKTKYNTQNFDEVTSTQLRTTIEKLRQLLETGKTE